MPPELLSRERIEADCEDARLLLAAMHSQGHLSGHMLPPIDEYGVFARLTNAARDLQAEVERLREQCKHLIAHAEQPSERERLAYQKGKEQGREELLQIAQGLGAVEELMQDSRGVYGYTPAGGQATWDELCAGGIHEVLVDFQVAQRVIEALLAKEAAP
jgi:hypothetical protein